MYYKDYYIHGWDDGKFGILTWEDGSLVQGGFESIEDCKLWIDELENEI